MKYLNEALIFLTHKFNATFTKLHVYDYLF